MASTSKRIKSPELNPCKYGQLIFDKGVKKTQWEKDSFFNKRCWGNWKTTYSRIKLDNFLTALTTTNLKRIKNLNIKTEFI